MASEQLKEMAMRGVAVAWVILWSCGALAQPMVGMARVNPAVTADQKAMQAMMAQMDAPYSGDPDRDFVTHMIGHHQGAIEMAQIELRYGHDAKIRKLATDIVAAQRREITVMQAWLGAHP